MPKNIVVIGSSNTDMILQMDHIPKPGETIIGGDFSMAAGGKGANQAVAAARAGGNVTFIARVGEDMFGEQAVKGFIDDGINVDHLIRDPQAPSGVALIFVAQDGENSIGVASGANGRLSPQDIEAAREVIASADILVMQLETPLDTVRAAAEMASANKVTVILDPAPAQPLSDDILKHVSIMKPNESEAEILTGEKVQNQEDAKKAAQTLMAHGVKTVLLTMGADGTMIATAEATQLIRSHKVKAVDSTAAGDVFTGSLSVALAEGRELTEAVKFANAAAALSVTKLGAQPSAPTKKEIEEFIKNN
ncbi:MAG: ribokinase [Planctomycetota bacterium]